MRRRIWSVGGALLLVAACRGRYVALDRASPEASRATDLHWLIFWVCGAVSVGLVACLGAALAVRSKPVTPLGDRRRGRIVGAVAAASALILLLLLTASVLTGRANVAPAGSEPLRIRITGHQWWWEVSYPAEPPSDTVITANEIHVPVGRPVRLDLSSADVIHSFWAPNINGKKDLIPGRPTTHVFRVDRPGVYEGRCAEFCGYQHAHMGFLLIGEEPARFEAWLDAQRRSAAEPSDEAAIRGRRVFVSSACVLCHTIRGVPAFGHKAPDLTHLASRRMIAAATLPNTAGHLAGWIVDSQRIKPGNRMPPNPLPPDDLLDMVSYLRGLR